MVASVAYRHNYQHVVPQAGSRSPALRDRSIDMTSADTTRTKMVLLVVMKRQIASIKASIAVLALCVSVLGLAACGAETGQQQEAQEAPQEAAGSSSGAGRGLVGTWEATETGGTLTFKEDGTFQAIPVPDVDPDFTLDGEYSVDGSYISMYHPEEGQVSQQEYTLEGDTLTMHTVVEDPQFPIDRVDTYKRKS